MTIPIKKQQQIRRYILKIEKEIDFQKDKQFFENRLFKVLFDWHSSQFGVSSVAYYDVTDKQTSIEYRVLHYLGNPLFDRSRGWYITLKEI